MPPEIFDFKIVTEIKKKKTENEIVVINKTKSTNNEIDLTPEIFKELYSYANPRLRRAMCLCIMIGCRFGRVETQNIKYDDFVINKGVQCIKVRNGKRKIGSSNPLPEFRFVPIPRTLLNIVEKWKKEDEEARVNCGYVIHWNNKKVQNLGNAWKKSKEKIGLENVKLRPYKHRHTIAQILIDGHVDRLAVAHILGHTSTKMLDKTYGPDTTKLQLAAIPIVNSLEYVKNLNESDENDIIDVEFVRIEKDTYYDYSFFSLDQLKAEREKIEWLIEKQEREKVPLAEAYF